MRMLVKIVQTVAYYNSHVLIAKNGNFISN